VCDDQNSKCGIFEFMVTGDGQSPNLNGKGLLLDALHEEKLPDGRTRNQCLGSIYQEAAWERMIEIPPQPLVAPYKSCTMSLSAAVQNTIGNANNIAITLASLALSIFLVIAVQRANTYRNANISTTSDKLELSMKNHELSDEGAELVLNVVHEIINVLPELNSMPAIQEYIRFEQKKKDILKDSEKEAVQNGGDSVKGLLADAIVEAIVG
jgi:hypothetical protein